MTIQDGVRQEPAAFCAQCKWQPSQSQSVSVTITATVKRCRVQKIEREAIRPIQCFKASEKNSLLWQTLDPDIIWIICEWPGTDISSGLSDQKSVRPEVIMRSSQACGREMVRRNNVNDNAVPGQVSVRSLLSVYLITRDPGQKLAHCGDGQWWGSRVITSWGEQWPGWAMNKAVGHYHYQDKLLIGQMTFISPRHLNCYKLVWRL